MEKKKHTKKKPVPYPIKEEESPIDGNIAMEAAEGLYARPAYNQIIGFIDKNRMAELLHISYKTLERYTHANKKFNPLESEVILKLKRLFTNGQKAFGSVDEFKLWLAKPAYGLGGKIPDSLLITPSGIDMVNDEVVKILFGDLA